ncbi:hypothetical protein BaRGS_00010735 [Batillaria attramentaria]|uniref:C1q domain-containing protein n=1 Tax=Batillaria attramentaria TaxID=370345 RepID=A0ABD0LGH2_9CAEN
MTWHDEVGKDLQACVGYPVTFGWNYSLDQSSENETRSQWTAVLNGRTVNLDENSTEFAFDGSGRMTLLSASLAHSGTYSLHVEVATISANGSEETKTYERSANLTVLEAPSTTGEPLQATLNPKPVKVQSGNQTEWGIELSFGTFETRGHPAVSAHWTTPSLKVLPSSSYSSGSFHLTVSNVETGPYRVQLSPKEPALRCSDQDAEVLRSALVTVEDITFRLMLLEVRAAELENRTAELAAKDSELDAKHSELDAKDSELENRTTELAAKNAELYAKDSELDAKDSELENRTAELAAKDSELDAKDSELETRTAELAAKNAELVAKDSELDAKDSELETRTAELAAKDSELETRTAELAAKNVELVAKDSELDAKDSELETRTAQLAAKDSELVAKDSELDAKDSELETRTAELVAKNAELVAKDSELDAKDSELETRTAQLAAKDSELAAKDSELETRTAQLAANDAELETRTAELEAKDSELAAKDSELETRTAQLAANDAELETRTAQLAAKDSELDAKDSELETRTAQLAAKDSELETRTAQLAAKDSELETRSAELEDTASALQKSVAGMDDRADKLESRCSALELRTDSPVVAFRVGLSWGSHGLRGSIRNEGYKRVVVFDTVFMNIGNGYNRATGKFTAPVGGLYVFFASYDCDEKGRYMGLVFEANGELVSLTRCKAPHSAILTKTPSVVVSLNKGQTALVRASRDSGTDPITWYYTYTFSGFLLQKF